MPDVTYEIVQHDGGWAYKVNGVFSETFSTHAEALAGARVASAEQEIPGHTEAIEYEDDRGKWHTETASGRDRPHTVVEEWIKLLIRHRDRVRPDAFASASSQFAINCSRKA